MNMMNPQDKSRRKSKAQALLLDGMDKSEANRDGTPSLLKKVFGRYEFLRSGLLIRLFKENFRQQAHLYVAAIVAMLVVAGATAASAWIIAEIVNGMLVTPDLAYASLIAGTVATIFIVKGVATYTQTYFLSRAGNRIIAEKQREIFRKIVHSDMHFIQTHVSSELLVRITRSAQAARSVIDTIVVSFVRDLFTIIGLIVVMFVQQPVLSLIVFVAGPIALLAMRWLLAKVRRIMEKEIASTTDIIRLIQETTSGFRVVKAYSLEPQLEATLDRAVANVERRSNAIARIEAATSPLMETLGGLAIAAVIALGAILVLDYGNTPGELASFLTAFLLAYEPAKRLARMRVSIESGMVGVRMLFQIIDHPVALTERPDAITLPHGPNAIEFDHVHFAYRDDQPVLRDLTVVFPAGKTTAIVGPSGSGKSTIINLMMRLFDPDSGEVRIDGTDIRRVTFNSLRERIAYVGQDAFLFSGSIRYNIAAGKPGASDAEIEAAARDANAHEFIMAMPHGYDSDVGENGGKLSGGQKQRIAIARAFLKDSPILILDEATSALDSEAEAAIRDALARLTAEKTTIIIAHRLSTVMEADNFIVLQNGEIVEQGDPKVLLKNQGLLRRLYDHQILPDL
jgi:ATP-binding cassette subfamily B protein